MDQRTAFTDEDVSRFNDKASKEERFLTLYQEREYLDAYARHTDIRVEDDPKWSIGRGDEWESHGNMQRDFLISQGLKPSSYLLDFGCGVGRAARKLVPYMEPGHYFGADISQKALAHAQNVGAKEGWIKRDPTFIHIESSTFDLGRKFDFVWAHSVFTHLPAWAIREVVQSIKDMLNPGGRFLFTYKHGAKPNRSGLKQFQYPLQTFEGIAQEFGMKARAVNKKWPATQITAEVRWGATAEIK